MVIPVNDIIFTDFESGDGILVDLNTKQYYRLNETGALIWRGVEKGRTVSDMAAEIQNVYDVTTEHAQTSIEKLLRTLESNKLVKRS